QEQSNPRCLQEEEGDNHLTPFSINLKAKIRIYNFTPQSYSLIRDQRKLMDCLSLQEKHQYEEGCVTEERSGYTNKE
uniref:hypothetical protein n=1 Tax=Bacteroides sp. ZJ-21 TaxID=2709391 RepID=UPI001980F527